MNKTQNVSRRWMIAAGFLAALLILGFNAYLLRVNTDAVRDHERWLRHTHDVISGLEETLLAVKTAESAGRAYLLTANDANMQTFEAALRDVSPYLLRLRELVSDNELQKRNVEDLREAIDNRLAGLQRRLRIRSEEGLEAAMKANVDLDARMLMVRAQSLSDEMRRNEQILLDKRTKDVQAAIASADRAFALQTVVNLLLVIITYILLSRFLIQQELAFSKQAEESWLSVGLGSLGERLSGDHSAAELSYRALSFFGEYIGAQVGAAYVAEASCLRRVAGYALNDATTLPDQIAFGEGLVGEAALQRRLLMLDGVPQTFLKVSSALGEAAPSSVTVLPLVFEGRLRGVLELGRLSPFDELTKSLLDQSRNMISISLASAEARDRMQALLEETQRQSEELQAQQEELRVSNEELEAQASTLKDARDRMQVQQEELRQTNEELSEQAQALAMQRDLVGARNADLEVSRQEIERKARELELASRYKSEFLANMSHELRTPLNSMLILATLLSENEEGRLTEKQVDFARTIHRAGNDLLELINDILDLAKVEAGKLDIHIDDVSLQGLLADVDRVFRHVAEAKGLTFSAKLQGKVPAVMRSDRQRLEQVLRNLLSNAIKFTEKGGVELSIESATDNRLRFRVRDSGIGIPKDKLALIFEAFQQGDGSTNRKFGGTGLGLTISRELARRLGGLIEVTSVAGEGSEFSLLLPVTITDAVVASASAPPLTSEAIKVPAVSAEVAALEAEARRAARANEPLREVQLSADLRAQVESARKIGRWILVVEDDLAFAEVLADVAREYAFGAVVSHDGETALALLQEYQPNAVLLDVKLPGVSGLGVLERLKDDPRTRHVAVHLISGLDYAQNAFRLGAVGYLVKPVSVEKIRASLQRIEKIISKAVKRVLIVEDDPVQRDAVARLIGGQDIVTSSASSAAECITLLRGQVFDCMILDLKLPDMTGTELLERLENDDSVSKPPVVIYTGKDLEKGEEERLRRYSESIIIKGARSPERLLDEVSLFMHRVEAEMPENSRAILRGLRQKNKPFAGKRILIVDDDMRNVFALTHALEAQGLRVAGARNGQEALSVLDQHGGEGGAIDLVLMDIMMPVMDGFEAMRRVRADRRFRDLPIIALTAKAMRGDQEKCFEAGANDYLPKPVNLETLISLLRVWLPPGDAT